MQTLAVRTTTSPTAGRLDGWHTAEAGVGRPSPFSGRCGSGQNGAPAGAKSIRLPATSPPTGASPPARAGLPAAALDGRHTRTAEAAHAAVAYLMNCGASG